MDPATYLFFNGNCFEAMTRYAEVLGGQVGSVVRNADAPNEESRMPGGDEMIMHMNIVVGSATIMASDCPDDMYEKPQGYKVSVAPGSREEFDRIHDALAKDATAVQMAPGETFWAERFAMFTDKYGTPWMLNFEGEKAAA